MLKNNSFVALVKREVIENKNSFIKVPVILLGIAILVMFASLLGLTNKDVMSDLIRHSDGAYNIGTGLAKAQEELEPGQLSLVLTMGYWGFSFVPMMVLPFIVFFSLLGSLYEERRDRTILFWKSMPVSDWQEVLAKLVAAVFIAPLLVLGVMIAGQLLTALFFSVTSLVQGGPFFAAWPLGDMISSWIGFVLFYSLQMLWMLPLFAWLLLASAYASRMPFMYAVLPPALVILIQGVFFDSTQFAEWLGYRLSPLNMMNNLDVHLNSWRDVSLAFHLSTFGKALLNSLSSGNFWFGLAIAAGLIYGAVELRKRAV